MNVFELSLDEIKPYENNPRKNDNAVDGVAESIKQFGFKQPLVVDSKNVIVVGHTRYKAAKKLGLKTVPCVRADQLTKEQVKEYRILDNKLNELAGWDFSVLSSELSSFKFDFGGFGNLFPPLSLPELDTQESVVGDLDSLTKSDSDVETAATVAIGPETDEKSNAYKESQAEWNNMPATENTNLMDNYISVTVYFNSVEKKIELGELLGKKISESTSFIYYPNDPELSLSTAQNYV